MRSVISEDVVANRFLLIGCAEIILLIVTLLIAAYAMTHCGTELLIVTTVLRSSAEFASFLRT